MISALRVLSSCGKWRRWWAEWLDGYHESTLSNFFLWTYFPCDFGHILKCNLLNWACVGFKKPILPYLKAALANKQQLYSVFLTKTRCAYPLCTSTKMSGIEVTAIVVTCSRCVCVCVFLSCKVVFVLGFFFAFCFVCILDRPEPCGHAYGFKKLRAEIIPLRWEDKGKEVASDWD